MTPPARWWARCKVGRDKQLDPLLLLAVIAIESRYNPLAESHGARRA